MRKGWTEQAPASVVCGSLAGAHFRFYQPALVFVPALCYPFPFRLCSSLTPVRPTRSLSRFFLPALILCSARPDKLNTPPRPLTRNKFFFFLSGRRKHLKTLLGSCLALLLGSVIHRYVVFVVLTVCAKYKRKENSNVALTLVVKTSESDDIQSDLDLDKKLPPTPPFLLEFDWGFSSTDFCSTHLFIVASSRFRLLLLLQVCYYSFYFISVCVYMCIRLFGIVLSWGCYHPAGRWLYPPNW